MAHEPTTLKFKRIVCRVDFSTVSVTALLAAADLAQSMKADLHVVNVIEASPQTMSWAALIMG